MQKIQISQFSFFFLMNYFEHGRIDYMAREEARILLPLRLSLHPSMYTIDRVMEKVENNHYLASLGLLQTLQVISSVEQKDWNRQFLLQILEHIERLKLFLLENDDDEES